MLAQLLLQNFRCYDQFHVTFENERTAFIGANASGKTSLVEAFVLVLTGKSFRASKAQEMIRFGQDSGRVTVEIREGEQTTRIETVIADAKGTSMRAQKRIFIDGIARSRAALVGIAPFIVFRPEELDIITGGPSLRRSFLDDTLDQVSREYISAKRDYERALKQRNALLHLAKETGMRKEDQFAYWDELLIGAGQTITRLRREFLHSINSLPAELFQIHCVYDPSEISYERLAQYAREEVAAGVTLVGPQRDDFFVFMGEKEEHKANMYSFASRGQQRLAILQLKLAQKRYIETKLGKKALVMLDDIFSELDAGHIALVMERLQDTQLIITTTHEEFLPTGDTTTKIFLT